MTSFASVKTVLGKVFRPIRRFAGFCHRGLCSLWLLPVRLYRKFLSPLKGQGSCRYVPTCSAYAVEAVTEWGILCGTLLALRRVIRCNPFSKGGRDPVPKRKEVFSKIRARLRRTKSQTPTEP